MPLSEEDIYRKEMDDAVADIKQQIETSKAHGVSPRLPDFAELFGKIIKGAKRDPRLTPKTTDALDEHAKKLYRGLATHAGLKGDVLMEPHVIRGLEVHVAILMNEGDAEVLTFADERHAINEVDQYLEKSGVKTTLAAIREFEASDKSVECSLHPLYDTTISGTRAETCPIR